MQSVRSILLEEVLLFFFLPVAQSCGVIHVKSPVIHIGSPLSASCTLQQEPCRGLEKGAVELLWKLDGNIIPNTHHSSVQENTSTVHFHSFNKTSGLLSCYIKSLNQLELVDRVQIIAGYPPSPPTNLNCLVNLKDDSLMCTWEPGRDSLIKTNVTLSHFRSKGQCETLIEKNPDCIPQEGQNSCTIPRVQFNPSQKIALWVTIQNALGSVTSPPLCLLPLNAVKLDPPSIEKVASPSSHPGCAIIEWRNAKHGNWIVQWYQLRYRRERETSWTQSQYVIQDSMKYMQCGLLPASKYHFQLRCIKNNLKGYWSEWGAESSLITEEAAPKEKLKTWWRNLQAAAHIQLLWKAPESEADRLYASPLSYMVKISPGSHSNDIVVCNTTALSCNFYLASGIRRASIIAYNQAGTSPETEILFYNRNGPPASKFWASPQSNYSLLVEWETHASVTGYVLEWCKYPAHSDCEVSWKMEPAGSRATILQDNIEPLQMYTIWLYALYEDRVGASLQINAYSKQGAPAFSPKLTLLSYSKSQASLSWEPVPVEKCYGFITKYTLFWTDQNDNKHSAALNASVTMFVIRNLHPSSVYKVLLMTSTAGGSVNGTVMVLHTPIMDELEIIILVFSLSCVMFFSAVSAACLCKHARMKKRLWPTVPDPANSSLRKWSPTFQESSKNTRQDGNLLITSDITIVEGWAEKKNLQKETSNFKQNYLQATNMQSLSTGRDTATLQSYVNVIDSVQYAQVITGGYRQQSPPASLYVRSDSTQPLLSDMSPSPKNYENMWFHSKQEDSVFLVEEEIISDFPLLQGLKLHEEGEVFSF